MRHALHELLRVCWSLVRRCHERRCGFSIANKLDHRQDALVADEILVLSMGLEAERRPRVIEQNNSELGWTLKSIHLPDRFWTAGDYPQLMMRPGRCPRWLLAALASFWPCMRSLALCAALLSSPCSAALFAVRLPACPLLVVVLCAGCSPPVSVAQLLMAVVLCLSSC